MSSKKVSEMPEKLAMAGADCFMIIDSEGEDPATQNCQVQWSNLGFQPAADNSGNQLGNDGDWVAAGDSATLDVGTGAGDVAAGNAPAAAVTSHESTYTHANLPTADQKAALAGTGTPGAGNRYVTEDEAGTAYQPAAPVGNQLGVNGGWTAAGTAAAADIGTEAGDVVGVDDLTSLVTAVIAAMQTSGDLPPDPSTLAEGDMIKVNASLKYVKV